MPTTSGASVGKSVCRCGVAAAFAMPWVDSPTRLKEMKGDYEMLHAEELTACRMMNVYVAHKA